MSPTNDEYEFLLETIKETVEEGQGETIYELGVGGEFDRNCEDIHIFTNSNSDAEDIDNRFC